MDPRSFWSHFDDLYVVHMPSWEHVKHKFSGMAHEEPHKTLFSDMNRVSTDGVVFWSTDSSCIHKLDFSLLLFPSTEGWTAVQVCFFVDFVFFFSVISMAKLLFVTVIATQHTECGVNCRSAEKCA